MTSPGVNKKDSILLSTKLKMPRPRRDYVVRRALFEKLGHSSEMGVIFVKGAAGMGKTTLLSSFIVETGLKNTAWLSLDETNNSVFSFWHYFSAAAGELLGEKVSFGVAPLFEQRDKKEDLVTLINCLCSEKDYYIVLDDFHTVTDPALIDTLEFFLRAMPENLHLFLLSRGDPPVYLGALAVSGRLLFLSSEDMKLSPEESLQFLKKTMKLKDDETRLRQISAFAEGWVGGLQLAAAGGDFSGELLKQGGGFAAEYLTREIFGKLSPGEQDFLVTTGVLSWFSGDICAGLFENLDFPSMLEELQNKNLFVVCIDEEKGIYRYHNILSEYLKQRFSELPNARKKAILQKAASGFAADGDYGEAARLLIQAEDYDGAAENILKMALDTDAGEYINRIPNDYVVQNIDLAGRSMIYNVDCGNMAKFDEVCNTALAEWKDSPLCDLLRYARSLLTRDRVENPPQPISVADVEKLKLDPETAAFILLGTANLLVMDRRYTVAAEYAERAQKMITANVSLHYFAYSLKSQLAEETGRLNDALQTYRQMKVLFEKSEPAFMSQYNYRIGIAGVYLKRMELAQARKMLDEAGEMLRGENIPESMVRFSLDYNEAEYNMLCGQSEKGAALIRRIIGGSTDLRRADRLLIELSAEGLTDNALKENILAEYKTCVKAGKSVSPAYELLCVRLYFKKGETEKARGITENVLTFSRENQNRLRLVEADLLLIQMTDESAPAGKRRRNNLLREAVYYSWENRIIQPFYVERRALNPLWKDFNVSLSDKLSEQERLFVRDVMRICSQQENAGDKGLLSSREQEVLAELAKGKTNPQIAEDLCISLSTVKTHVLSIYGKLGVSSRVSAAKEGKRLGLIR